MRNPCAKVSERDQIKTMDQAVSRNSNNTASENSPAAQRLVRKSSGLLSAVFKDYPSDFAMNGPTILATGSGSFAQVLIINWYFGFNGLTSGNS